MFLLEAVNGAKAKARHSARIDCGFVKLKGKQNVIQFVRFMNGKSTYYKTPPNNMLALEACGVSLPLHHNMKSYHRASNTTLTN